jgi:hypothetical protein
LSTDAAIAGTALDPGVWSGKRRTRRVRLVIPVACRGVGSEIYPGRTVDMSRGGMLVGLAFAAIRTVSDPTSLIELTNCVSSLFPHGIDVEFFGRQFRVKAHVVRLVLDLRAPYPLLLGCHFDPMLSESECIALGVPISQDETRPDGPKLADATNDLGAPGARRDVPTPVVTVSPAPAAASEAPPTAATPSSAPATPAEIPAAPVAPTFRLEVRPSPFAPSPAPESPPAVPPAPVTPPIRLELPPTPVAPTPAPVTSPEAPSAPAAPSFMAGRTIAAHLFPAWSQIGTRYSGRLASIHVKDAVVILTAPAGETDAVGWAAGLGSKARVTLLKSGALIGDLRARVTRIDAAGPNEAKLTLALASPFKSL